LFNIMKQFRLFSVSRSLGDQPLFPKLFAVGIPIASETAIDEIRSLPATKRGQSFIGWPGGQF
jgi:hypothetical protein